MKRYKLIKPYLGCPYELNQEIDTDFIWVNSKKIYLKDYPENWEEVIEKDYEILSFKAKLFPRDIWNLLPNGKYNYGKIGKGGNYKDVDINACLKMFNIHSVKRLSDGEVFTVSDGVALNNQNHFPKTENILEIKIIKNEIRFKMNFQKNHPWDSSYKLNFINKIKQPLFTTEDGVDIFEGDEFWYVTTKGFKLWTKTCDSMSGGWAVNAKKVGDIPFSTKEAAEEYVLMKTPLLCLEDIFRHTALSKEGTVWAGLKDLVKSRL
jgi:hypothetical protein